MCVCSDLSTKCTVCGLDRDKVSDVETTNEKAVIRSAVYVHVHVPVFMSVCMSFEGL